MPPVLMAIGGLGLTAQVVILRELIAAFAGNEVSSGIFLAVWLVSEGLGAWFFGKVLGKIRGKEWFWLYGVALVSALSSAGAVLAVTLLRPLLGFLPGESLDIGALFAITLLVVLLPAGTHGGLFVLGAAILSRIGMRNAECGMRKAEGGRRKAEWVGRTYLYEGLGTVLAAVICYFLLLPRVCGLGIVFLFAGILLIVLWALGRELSAVGSRRLWRLVCLVVGGVFFVLVPSGARELERMVWERNLPGQKVLKVKDSPYGKVTTMEREGQRLLLYNGVAVFSLPQTNIGSLEEFIHFPLLFHPEPKQVLLFAGGMGGAVKEVLKHPVEKVVVVELDPILVDEIRWGGGRLVAEELSDPRVILTISDPRRFLMVTQDSFDLILLMSSAPFSLSANRLFTKEFFSLVKSRLKKGGIFVTRTVGGGETPTPEVIALLRIRQATLAQVFPQVKTYVLDFPLILAGEDSFTLSVDELFSRLRERNLNLTFLNPDYLTFLLDDFRQERYLGNASREPRAESRQPNTDIQPREVFLNMAYEQRRLSSLFSRLYYFIPKIANWIILIFLFTLLIAGIAGGLVRGGDFARGLGIWTSGFIGAGISTLAILIYQVKFGSVYSGVALLLAGFMFGTVPGAWFGTSFTEDGGERTVSLLFTAGEVVLILLVGGLILLTRYGSGPVSFLLLLILTGMCLGWQFALASSRRLTATAIESERAFISAGTIAGRLSILDFTGGAFGGLIIAVIIVPWFGLISATIFLGGIKIISLITQLSAKRG
ncbi:MAG: hypothetical protein ABIK39_05825 [candidate division WOR-3 bacterium]